MHTQHLCMCSKTKVRGSSRQTTVLVNEIRAQEQSYRPAPVCSPVLAGLGLAQWLIQVRLEQHCISTTHRDGKTWHQNQGTTETAVWGKSPMLVQCWHYTTLCWTTVFQSKQQKLMNRRTGRYWHALSFKAVGPLLLG